MTLGNLTLLGNNENRKIKDRPFVDKRPVYIASKLSLNEYFHSPTLVQWGKKEIEARAKKLAETAALICKRPPDADELLQLF